MMSSTIQRLGSTTNRLKASDRLTICTSTWRNTRIHDGVTEDEFVRQRHERDRTLPFPGLLLDALQVNIRGGRLPEPEANGISYLKIPLNRFRETGCAAIRNPKS